jgi:hypothetical protein
VWLSMMLLSMVLLSMVWLRVVLLSMVLLSMVPLSVMRLSLATWDHACFRLSLSLSRKLVTSNRPTCVFQHKNYSSLDPVARRFVVRSKCWCVVFVDTLQC